MIPVLLKKLFLAPFPTKTAEDLRRIRRGVFSKAARTGRPVFVLGVGAQKAGTSWLHDYLSLHPSTDMGFDKEYHVFNRRFIAGHRDRDRFLEGLLGGSKPRRRRIYWKDELRSRMTEDLGEYFSYFAFRVRFGKSIYLTGDMTPEYCALAPGVYSLIRNNLIERGMRPKVIFLMRDPVERCISASRMLLKGTGVERTESTENAMVEEHYRSEEAERRARYDRTIKNLEAVFQDDEILYVFYEELFNETTLRTITDFLDLDYVPADFSKMVNVSRTDNPIDDRLRAKIYGHYREVYDFVSDRFGEEKVASLWKSRRDYR